jgi:peptide chain release factor 2
LTEASEYLRIDEMRTRLTELEGQISQPDLWDDQDLAKRVNTEYSNIKSDVDVYDSLNAQLDDFEVLHQLSREEQDESHEQEIQEGITMLGLRLSTLELRSLFTEEHDEADAIVHINTKDGGVDAQDWSELLLRMYTRWAERRGFILEIDNLSPGTEAGIMSAEFTIKGRYAYGLMRSERGAHRLVRISPFDNQGRRQTSFSLVQVWPEMDEPDVEINESDIRMEVFRASGAGGAEERRHQPGDRRGALPECAHGGKPHLQPSHQDRLPQPHPAGAARPDRAVGSRRPLQGQTPA